VYVGHWKHRKNTVFALFSIVTFYIPRDRSHMRTTEIKLNSGSKKGW